MKNVLFQNPIRHKNLSCHSHQYKVQIVPRRCSVRQIPPMFCSTYELQIPSQVNAAPQVEGLSYKKEITGRTFDQCRHNSGFYPLP